MIFFRYIQFIQVLKVFYGLKIQLLAIFITHYIFLLLAKIVINLVLN